MFPRIATRPFFSLMTLSLASGVMGAETFRDPNMWESAYAIIAIDARVPELCAKISPQAEEGVGFGEPGRQTWFVRSKCYFDVAVETGSAKLCAEVKSHSTAFLDGSGISATQCLKAVLTSSGPSYFKRVPEGSAVTAILTKMGYTKDSIPANLVRQDQTNEEFMWLNYYKSLATTPGFRARLDRLPDFSSGAATDPSIVCKPQYIPTRRPTAAGGRDKDVCCPDFNGDGRCDDAEPSDRDGIMNDLTITAVEGKPPSLLCGEQPLLIEVRLRNTGAKTFRGGVGWVEISNMNSLLFGPSTAPLRVAIPEVPPGGETTVALPPLRLAKPPTLQEHFSLAPRVLTRDATYNHRWVDLNVDFEPGDSARCTAEQTLRNNPASYGGEERRKKFASEKDLRDLHIEIPFERTNAPIQEGVPFEIKLNMLNHGSAAVDAGSGVLLLVGDDPRGFSNRSSDLIRLLPDVGPGESKTMSFSGLVYRSSPYARYPQQTDLHIVLCTRDGCNGVAGIGKGVIRSGEPKATRK